MSRINTMMWKVGRVTSGRNTRKFLLCQDGSGSPGSKRKLDITDTLHPKSLKASLVLLRIFRTCWLRSWKPLLQVVLWCCFGLGHGQFLRLVMPNTGRVRLDQLSIETIFRWIGSGEAALKILRPYRACSCQPKPKRISRYRDNSAWWLLKSKNKRLLAAHLVP